MKRLTAIFIALVLFSGCSTDESDIYRILHLRELVLSSDSCSFSLQITVDYPSESYNFAMDCTADSQGETNFIVTEPNSIAGITGQLSKDNGKLTFDDKYLVFSPLADGLITPVCAPWIFINTIRSGYIAGCTSYEDGLTVEFNDCYQQESLDLILMLDKSDMPFAAEIIWQGRRIVTIKVDNFTFV